jgi:prophage antirepressor-like protein
VGSSNYIRKEAHPVTAITPFELPSGTVRFGQTADGTPYAVAADFAKAMGYGQASDATRLLDSTEKGQQIVQTPGGAQQMSVIFEDGLWELIFRSTLPGARAVKARVKVILREIRETGRYEVTPAPAFQIPASFAEALELAARQARELEAATERVAELEPAAASWSALADATGDYSVADAAKILTRGGIPTGRDRLFATLQDLAWTYRQGTDGRYRAYQTAVNRGWLAELPKSHTHPRTGEAVLDPPQIRVTVKGLHELRLRLLPPMDIPPLFPAA